MNWLSRFLPGGGGPSLSPVQQGTLETIAALPAPDLNRVHYETRYVVVNAEVGPEGGARGLLAVGAVAITQGLLHPDDAFQARLGSAPADALIGLLRFIARAPVVVFNAQFNQGSLERAFEQHLGSAPVLEWLDLLVLLPSLYPERIDGQARMDAWLAAFGIQRLERSALLEAFAVAQLHQVVLARAGAQGLTTARDLVEAQSSRKWLRGA